MSKIFRHQTCFAFSVTRHRQNHHTPTDEIVILHVMILAEVDCNYFAPEQQSFNQHPTECCHEEKMEQRSNKCACHLQLYENHKQRNCNILVYISK